MTGWIVNINQARGFAFIRRDDGGGDVFLHAQEVRRAPRDGRFGGLWIGQRVWFTLGMDAGRPCALDVQLLDEWKAA